MQPVADFIADTLYSAGPLSIQFHDRSRGGRTSWLWDFGDGGTSTEQNPVHTYVTADTFTVSLNVTGPDGTDEMVKENYIIVTEPVGVAENDIIVPNKFHLYQNHPNPFNPSTTIRYDVKEPCPVELKIFDLQGREMETLVRSVHSLGRYDVEFHSESIPSGVYVYRIRMGDFVDVKKMVKLD
jgi:PKD repeat protein